MKKFVAVIIAGCLIAGAVSCGGQESESTRTRNGVVADFAVSTAINAVLMIPGMPKELDALLGGNAAEFAAISAALARIEQKLDEMDKKLDQIKADLVKIQNQITDVQAALTSLITLYGNEQCQIALEAKKTALQPTLAVIDDNYKKLYGPSAVIPNIIKKWKNYLDVPGSAAPDYAIESAALATVYAELDRNPNFQTALSVLTTNVVHGPEAIGATTGVILKMMQCTVGMEASQKRFLTHDDSVRWKALGDYYELEAKKALILSSFMTTYQPQGRSVTPDFISFNQKRAQYLSLQKNINLMTSSLIPLGQVFDYKTGRMWTRGLASSDARITAQVSCPNFWTNTGCAITASPQVASASGYTTMYKAMRSCVQSGDLVMDNKAYTISPAGINTLSTLSRCLMANPRLDTRPATVSEWRLPEVSEIVSPGKGGLTSTSSTNVGLIDDWGKDEVCGTPRKICVSPTQYLKAQGATSLIPANEDTSFVWTNTSQASQLVASNTGTADERARYREIKEKLNDRFMENQTSTDGLQTTSVDVGINSQTLFLIPFLYATFTHDSENAASNATCVFPGNTLDWQTPAPPTFANSLLNNRSELCTAERRAFVQNVKTSWKDAFSRTSWQWSQCDALLENKPSTLRYASVHVVNLGLQQSPLMKEEGGRAMVPIQVDPGGGFGVGAGVGVGNAANNYKTMTIAGKYAPTPAGMVATFFGGGAFNNAVPGSMSNRVVTCVNRLAQLPNPNWWEKVFASDFFSPLAQMANTILVRNLFPNERYFFKDLDAYRTAFSNGPIQTVFSVITPQTTAANPDAKTYISTTSQSSDVKCVVDPVTAPTNYSTLAAIKTTGEDCAFGYLNLAPGPHIVYAAATDGSFFSEAITVPTVNLPLAPPAKPGMPTVKLGVRAATITIKTNPDLSITKYMVKSVGDDKSCEISVPASNCTISDLIVGEIYSFTVTAVNPSGMSLQSSETPGLVPLAVPLSPTNLLITSNREDVVVSVIADPKSESVDEFVVTLSPQVNGCSVDPIKRVCIIKNVPRNVKYIFSAVSVNSGGESGPLIEEYFHPPAPTAPSNLTITPSPSSLVINFDTNSINSSTKSVKMVLSPGGKSCTVTLPSSNCEIDVDTTQSYTVAATSYSADGESSKAVRSLSKTFLESTKVDLVIPATGTTVAPNLTLSLKKAVSAKWVAAYAKIKVASTSTVSLSVSAGSALYCRVSGTSLKGLKAGSCKVTVSVSPKKGKAISKTVTIKVSK